MQIARNKRRKVRVLDVGEIADIEEAIKLSRRCISKNKYARNLENTLNLLNLRIADVQ